MSNNVARADGTTTRHSHANVRFEKPQRDVKDRYAVVPASFMVLDKHTGHTVQIYRGADAEVRAEHHARHLRARHRRLTDQSVADETD